MAKGKITTTTAYGIVGYGTNKAAAKADAEIKIYRALEGSYTPKMIRFDAGWIGLIFRDIYSWNYNILAPQAACGLGSLCGGYETRDGAERSLRVHIAQNLIGATPDNGLSVILHEGDRQGHREYIAWQQRYAVYKTQGYTDQDCHRMACESRAFCPVT